MPGEGMRLDQRWSSSSTKTSRRSVGGHTPTMSAPRAIDTGILLRDLNDPNNAYLPPAYPSYDARTLSTYSHPLRKIHVIHRCGISSIICTHSLNDLFHLCLVQLFLGVQLSVHHDLVEECSGVEARLMGFCYETSMIPTTHTFPRHIHPMTVGIGPTMSLASTVTPDRAPRGFGAG
jgi:hypothetical protein